MKNLPPKYDYKMVENGKYEFWKKNNLFKPGSGKEAFSIVLPPPNVTGHLHLGHAWDGTLQDLLIRFKKLNGYKTIWIPGMDHAGIATQTKFEKILKKEKNLTKEQLGRAEFLKHLTLWANEQKTFIRSQWATLGFALDYSKEKYTMDKDVSEVVTKIFVDLYKNKLIYRGKKLINWDIKQQTAISNIEVIHEEQIGKMYYIRYQLVDSNDFLTVATTRPETIFGDVCLVVNPEDKRYIKCIGKKVINPLNKKQLPIIADNYVDQKFGTGVLKCTPGHDFNDAELGKKHKLETINVMNANGTLNKLAGKYNNLDRFIAREKCIEELKENNLLEKIEDHKQSVGYSERSDTIVEPLLSEQWFVKMKPLAKKVIENQKTKNAVELYPKRFNNTLLTWLKNVEDWCISRQMLWGHQIPAWTNRKTGALAVELKAPKGKDWIRSTDVLDTWFSSALWPFVTTEWQLNNKFYKTFFPTNVLVTGYDIIFFWVSRMMFQSQYFTNKIPFKKVLIHGLIRDEQGRKMSKSLGNGIDPMEVVENYGADALRMFLCSSSTAGEDLRYSETKVKASWNILNKLWNSARFIFMNSKQVKMINKVSSANQTDQGKWIICRLNQVINSVQKNIDDFNFTTAYKVISDFVWLDFCNTYIELEKINMENPKIQPIVINNMYHILKAILIMLHPFAPFITEELYQMLPKKKKSIMLESWPKELATTKEKYTSQAIKIIEVVRKIRWEKNIANKVSLQIYLITQTKVKELQKNIKEIERLLHLVNVTIKGVSTIPLYVEKISVVDGSLTIEIPTAGLVDNNAELKKHLATLEFLTTELERSNKILSNDNFISKAPKEKVDAEKQKRDKYQEEYNNIKKLVTNIEQKTKSN